MLDQCRPHSYNTDLCRCLLGCFFASVRKQSILISIFFVCGSVCMSVRVACQEQRASRLLPQILRACLFVAVAQFLLVANSNWRCTMLCTSGFVDDVVFSITRPVRQATQVGCSLKVTRQGAAPICHRDVYSNRLTRGQHRTRRGGV